MSFPYLSDVVQALFGVALPLPVPMFGLMMACALFACVALLRHEVARLHAQGRIGLAWQRGKHFLPPQEIVADLAAVSLVAGVLGARLFHLLEHADAFWAHPWQMLFSRAGFTFYGGLIAGLAAGVVYLRQRRVAVPVFCDAAAPAIMLGYGIGRLGCQISGDGDWGMAADLAGKPDWLPLWLWAQTYEGNILGEVIPPPGVYPTPIYESATALCMAMILWRLRTRRFPPGSLFAGYLLLAGIERLAVEQIRVNTTLHLFALTFTQAEIISASLLVLGGGWLFHAWRLTTGGPDGNRE